MGPEMKRQKVSMRPIKSARMVGRRGIQTSEGDIIIYIPSTIVKRKNDRGDNIQKDSYRSYAR